jgi:hypothetical protein
MIASNCTKKTTEMLYLLPTLPSIRFTLRNTAPAFHFYREWRCIYIHRRCYPNRKQLCLQFTSRHVINKRKKTGVSAGMEMTRKYCILPSRERKFCSRKYLHVLENRICYWIVLVSPESSDREVQKYLLGLWNIWWHMPFLLIYEHPIWYWIIILTRANISYGFFHKIYRRCPPR